MFRDAIVVSAQCLEAAKERHGGDVSRLLSIIIPQPRKLRKLSRIHYWCFMGGCLLLGIQCVNRYAHMSARTLEVIDGRLVPLHLLYANESTV